VRGLRKMDNPKKGKVSSTLLRALKI